MTTCSATIIDQCVDLNIRRISPYLMNEPLMDPALPERIHYISQKKKRRQYTKINSNGSMLSETMTKRIDGSRPGPSAHLRPGH